jgi:glycosyltransferase involved in cell wall biosynthesis
MSVSCRRPVALCLGLCVVPSADCFRVSCPPVLLGPFESSPLMSTTDRVILDRAATMTRSRSQPDGSLLQAAVIVATFNRPGAVTTVLSDLAKQTVLDFDSDRPDSDRPDRDGVPFEVIVINDGGDVDVATEVPDDLPFRTRLVVRSNGGPARARHSAILRTCAPIIIVVDDDMRIDPDFVKAHLAQHRRGAEVVYGMIATQPSGDEPLFTRFHDQHIQRWLDACRRGEVPRGELLCTGNVSFRRSEYLAIGGFDQSLVRMEDRDLGIRFEEKGLSFAFAVDAISTHQSDHTDVAVWRSRSRVYGTSDLAIARKYPQRADLSPWSFLSELPLVVHPLLIMSACLPFTSNVVGSVTYGLARLAERVGRRRVGVKLAGLTYGIDYYAGVGRGWGSWRTALAELKRWKAMAS